MTTGEPVGQCGKIADAIRGRRARLGSRGWLKCYQLVFVGLGVLSGDCNGGHILSMAQDSSQFSGGEERRRNPRLRELVDEMLATIRAAHHVDLWTPQERASCEAEMARIMGTVREHALSRSAKRDH